MGVPFRRLQLNVLVRLWYNTRVRIIEQIHDSHTMDGIGFLNKISANDLLPLFFFRQKYQ